MRLCSGYRTRTGFTRCGAIRCRSRPRSIRASRTSRKSSCSRYRMPPCTSLDDRLEVPEAKSRASSRPTLSPRVAASTAEPAPTMPPPTTRMSSSVSLSAAIAAARSAGPSRDGYVTAGLEAGVACLSPPGADWETVIVLSLPGRRRPATGLLRSVGRDNDLDALELLQVRVSRRGHAAAQGSHEIRRALRDRSRPVQDLLERGDLADGDAVAARKLRVVRLSAPVPAAAGRVRRTGERGAQHD